MKTFALIENGSIHTDELSLEWANEMLESHEKFFPDENWEVKNLSEGDEGMGKLEGLMERQNRIAKTYYSV